MKRKGYTLIELIVVIAIIGIIASIIIPAIINFVKHHKKDPEPTNDWVIVLSESGNKLYNCRSINTDTGGQVKVWLSDGSQMTLSSNNCIVLENASEDLLYAMKQQYIDTQTTETTTTEETTTTTTTEETTTTTTTETTTTSEVTTTTVTTTATTAAASKSNNLTALGTFTGTYYPARTVPCRGGSGRTLIDCTVGSNGVKGSVASRLVYQNYGYNWNGARTKIYIEFPTMPSMTGWYYVDDCNGRTDIIDFYFHYSRNCPWQQDGVITVKAYI